MKVDDMMPSAGGISHVRLTVTDIARSKAFYTHVFGSDPAMDFSGQVYDPAVREDPDRLFGGCMFALGAAGLGLRPAAHPGQSGAGSPNCLPGSPGELARAVDG